MSNRVRLEYSRSQVNKAGDLIRDYLNTHRTATPDEIQRAVDIVHNFRAAHQYPLIKATMGLRSMVRTEGARVEVSQRLKRWVTIVDKLRRQPKMALARMQDIGGCRAVLADIDEVNRVLRRMKKNGKVKRVVDYITDPAPSGYRSLHVIVEYDECLIEAQLRTTVQHEWAVTVERLGGRLGEDLKSGYGPPEILDFLEAASRAMAIEEAGGVVDSATMEEMARLRLAASPYLFGDT